MLNQQGNNQVHHKPKEQSSSQWKFRKAIAKLRRSYNSCRNN